MDYSNNTNAGTATASASFAASGAYLASTDSKPFAIAKASSSVSVTCSPGVYTGSATPCTGTPVGAGTVNTSIPVSLSYNNNSNAGSATVSATWAGDANHTAGIGSGSFVISKAGSQVALICPSDVVYDGAAHPCTGTVTGANLATTPSIGYSPNATDAGQVTATGTYAGDTNHEAGSTSKQYSIGQAGSTVTVTCGAAPQVYDGAAHASCTAVATGANLNQSVDVTYDDNTNAGLVHASATFAGDSNHTGSTGSATFTIAKAPATALVTCPATRTYTGVGLTPCSATVSGAGGLSQALTPSYAHNVVVGTATASASYAGDANHFGDDDTSTFQIVKAASSVSVSCPASVVYDATAQEPCTADVDGVGGVDEAVTATLHYSANTNADTASVYATWPGDANHDGSASEVETFVIEKAASTTSAACDDVTYTGAARIPCAATVTGVGGVDRTTTGHEVYWSYANNTNATTPSAKAQAQAFWPGDANHVGTQSSVVEFDIAKAVSVVTVVCAPTTTVYTGTPRELCSAGVTGAGGLDQALTVGYAGNTNAGTATASASYDGDANHLGDSGSATFAITAAPSTVEISCPPSVVFDGSAQTPCSAVANSVGVTNQPVGVTYTDNVHAGPAHAAATYAGDTNHQSASDTETFTIDRAPSTVVVDCPPSATYTGAAIEPCTASVTGADELDEEIAEITYTGNVNVGLASATAAYVGDDDHLPGLGGDTFAITQAGSTTSVTCPASVTYTGSAQTPCTAGVTGVGGLNQPSPVELRRQHQCRHGHGLGQLRRRRQPRRQLRLGDLRDRQGDSTMVVSCPDEVTYTGRRRRPCTATVTGVGGLNQSVTVTYGDNINAGTATASASYAGDANHEGGSDTETFEITRPTLDRHGHLPDVGRLHRRSRWTPCTATVDGAGGLDEAVAWRLHRQHRCRHRLSVRDLAGDANHDGPAGRRDLHDHQGRLASRRDLPDLASTPARRSTPCTADVTGAGGLDADRPPVTHSDNINAGTASASAAYAGDANHTRARTRRPSRSPRRPRRSR